MFNETFKRFLLVASVLVIWLAAAVPVKARSATFADAPANDSRAKAAVNRAWSAVRSLGPQAVAEARVSCAAVQGGSVCSDGQVIDALVGAKSFYRGAYTLDGDNWSIDVMSLSTSTLFGVSQGRRVCSNPGRGGCPASGVWGGRGFAIKLTTREMKSR